MDDDLKGKIKTAATTAGGLAIGGVLFGPVGAIAIGGIAGYLSFRRWQAKPQGPINAPPPSDPTTKQD